MLVACSDNVPGASGNETVENLVKDVSEQEVKAQDIPEYKIMEDTVESDIKRTVKVELVSRIDEAQLKLLAEQIHALKDTDVQRTFISYRIAGEHSNQAYWATTHYNPELEIKIIGESAANYDKIKNTALPEGEVLGAWMVSQGFEYKAIAFKKDGKTYIRTIHSDDSTSDEIYELSQSDKGIKLQDEGGKDFGEYFIINKEGGLEFWSENGNYYTAPKA